MPDIGWLVCRFAVCRIFPALKTQAGKPRANEHALFPSTLQAACGNESTPVSVIKAGEVIARIHMYKIATLGSGNPRNFTWNIISNNSVVMPTGGCTVDSRNVTVNLPDFPGSAEIPLGVYCSSEQKLSFYLSGATTDSARQVFANTAPDATKASGVGVSLMRNGKILATGENVSLGTVNKSKVPLGLSATYGQTGNKVSAGTVQSVIGVTFIYE